MKKGIHPQLQWISYVTQSGRLMNVMMTKIHQVGKVYHFRAKRQMAQSIGQIAKFKRRYGEKADEASENKWIWPLLLLDRWGSDVCSFRCIKIFAHAMQNCTYSSLVSLIICRKISSVMLLSLDHSWSSRLVWKQLTIDFYCIWATPLMTQKPHNWWGINIYLFYYKNKSEISSGWTWKTSTSKT